MTHIHKLKQLCTGCGVCAGICKSINMQTGTKGLYYPVVDEKSCVNCGRCVSICPVLQNENDKKALSKSLWEANGLQYKAETGYYYNCYEGFVAKKRSFSASGGFCSELLSVLIGEKWVDAIYCAHKTNDCNRLFVSQRMTTEQEIEQSAGSAYYPIEISFAVKEIIGRNEQVAIVCLPCQATALRLAMKNNKALKQNIRYIIGLICGGMPGKEMLEYIAADAECDLNTITKATFREKDKGIKCNNCQVKLYSQEENARVVSRYHNGEAFGFVYFNHFFHNEACEICTDAFAEEADIVFGDAWFDENKTNEMGTSICISRNFELDSIMHRLSTDTHLSKIERMILAQNNVGVVGRKKTASYYYRNYYLKKGFAVGVAENTELGFKGKIRTRITRFFTDNGQHYWGKYKSGKISFSKLNSKLHSLVKLKKKVL